MGKILKINAALIFFEFLNFINFYALTVSNNGVRATLIGAFMVYHVLFLGGIFIAVNTLLREKEKYKVQLKIALDMCADLIKERHNESEE